MNHRLCISDQRYQELTAGRSDAAIAVADVLARAGRFPATLISLQPDILDFIATTHEQSFGETRVAECVGRCATLNDLNLVRYRLTLRSFFRELIGVSVRETTREFSILAAQCVAWVLDDVARDLSYDATQFGVLGLGKFGGFELNYGSDIDLIFYAGSVNEKTTEFARTVVERLSHRDEVGFLFRVDLNLRPNGSQGPLVQSVDAMRKYYLEWGRTWERGAMMKARPIAGNRKLGREFLTRIEPFLYRKHLDFDSIESLRAMRDAILEHARQLDSSPPQQSVSAPTALQARLNRRLGSRAKSTPSTTPRGWDVKIGTGGIREIEFFVQALQLVHSGRDVQLRTSSTLEGIARLVAAGVISDRNQQELASAYELYRRIEHVLQLDDNRQTHLLTDAQKGVVAARLGYERSEFDRKLNESKSVVSGLFGRLFSDTDKSADRPTVDRGDNPAALLSAVRNDRDVDVVFSRFGFRDPRSSGAQLKALRDLRFGPFAEPSEFSLFVLSAIIGSPDPDLALSQLLRFVTAVGDRPGYFNMLAQNPHTTQLLIHLLGGARTLAHALIRDPNVFGRLLSVSSVAVARDASELEEQLAERLLSIDDQDHRYGIIRRFQQEELLRIGLHMSGQAVEPESAFLQLSNLADVVLTTMVRDVYEPLRDRKRSTQLPDLAQLPFIVVALGKLGGREFGFGSDLDLMFVYEDDRQYRLSHAFFSKLAQRFVRTLSGPSMAGRLYTVDTRLRPSGSKGALVVSLASLRDYHATSARTWERQSLLRARVVFGHPQLADKFTKFRTAICSSSPDRDALRRDVWNMRNKVVSAAGKTIDLKSSPGGLIDSEFAAQYLQLVGDAPLTQNTADAIRGNTILAPNDTQLWAADHLRLRQMEALLRINDMSDRSTLPASEKERDVFARRAGFNGAAATDQLDASIRATMGRVAATALKILD